MRYPHHSGVGERIRGRLLALGYAQPSGAPDLARFIREKRYDPRYFYRWANKDQTPTGENLTRLAADLGVTRAWLLFNEGPEPKAIRRRLLPIGGGSGDADARPLPSLEDVLPIIGSWLRRWLMPLPSYCAV